MERRDIQDATGRLLYNPGYGQMHAWGKVNPVNGDKGFAPGCLYQNVAGSAGTVLWVNTGTFSSATWVNLA